MIRWSVWAVILLLVVGCGKRDPTQPTTRLEGKVTINGQAIPADADGSIRFMPSGGGGQATPTSAKIENGVYRAGDVPVGKLTAIFSINRPTGKMVIEAPGGAPYPERQNLVPVSKRQGIPLEVTADMRQQDFDLRN